VGRVVTAGDDRMRSYRELWQLLERQPETAQRLTVNVQQLRDVLGLAHDALVGEHQAGEVNMGLTKGNKARGQVTPKDRAAAVKAGRIRRKQKRAKGK
jgi:hypothetical protein